MSDGAKTNQDAKPPHGPNFAGKKSRTCFRFLRGWPVFRGSTANGVGDTTIPQNEAVEGVRSVRSLSKPPFKQSCVQKVSGIVPGEGPAGSVCAAQTGR